MFNYYLVFKNVHVLEKKKIKIAKFRIQKQATSIKFLGSCSLSNLENTNLKIDVISSLYKKYESFVKGTLKNFILFSIVKLLTNLILANLSVSVSGSTPLMFSFFC